MPTMPGPDDKFGPYLIRRLLGSGAMGAVYVAAQTALGRDVALKVLLPMHADEPDYRARFAREAAALARVDSPHIIQIFDYGEHEGRLFIATQLVSGGDLGLFLHERGALPVADACLLAAQIAAALADAHEAGVIHRDVKPANVLLRGSGDRPHVYLCDFGIATDGGQGLTSTGAVVGTWAYLAPERCHGADASRASDIYGLGCLLWQLLTGKPPYVGSPAHVAVQHLSAAIPQLAGKDETTASINNFLRRALAKEVGERESDAAAASVELERIGRIASQGGAVHAEPARPTAPAPSNVDPKWASSPGLTPPAGVVTEPIDRTPDLEPPVESRAVRRAGARRTVVVTAVVIAAVLGIVGGLGVWLVDRSRDDGSGVNADKDGNGASTELSPVSVGEGRISHRLTTGDFNGDGEGDGLIQIARGTGSSDLMLISGADDESAQPRRWARDTKIPLNSALTAADFNRDGITDVIALWRDTGERIVRLYLGGDSGFSDAAEVGSIPTEGSVALLAGDFNGDEFADLIAMTTDEAGRSQLFMLAWGDGAFEKAQEQTWHPEWAADGTVIRAADVNGDGDSDVIALPPDTDEVWVFRTDGGQLVEGELWGKVERQPNSHAVASDFDGDKLGDLAVMVDRSDGVEVRVALSEDDDLLPAETWLTIPGWSLDTMWPARTRVDDGATVDMKTLHYDGDNVVLSALISDGEEFAPPKPLRSIKGWQW